MVMFTIIMLSILTPLFIGSYFETRHNKELKERLHYHFNHKVYHYDPETDRCDDDEYRKFN